MAHDDDEIVKKKIMKKISRLSDRCDIDIINHWVSSIISLYILYKRAAIDASRILMTDPPTN